MLAFPTVSIKDEMDSIISQKTWRFIKFVSSKKAFDFSNAFYSSDTFLKLAYLSDSRILDKDILFSIFES